jgi:hypothetical protein
MGILDMDDLKVFILSREATCAECQQDLGLHPWVTLQGEKAICLKCADLDHLVFLPAGNTAVTRRSRKYSTLCAVVLKWSRARKRYERQGLLVEEQAVDRAEEECAGDEDKRRRLREKAAERRNALDQEFIQSFAKSVRNQFPSCPPDREFEIARHACQKYSGRIGRSSAARDLEPNAVRLAVIAHIRHQETDYDDLLMEGMERIEARARVQDTMERVAREWGQPRP